MPNGGGVQAFEQLKILKETSHIPVIFITAYPKPELKDMVLKLEAAGFITKPFNGDLLKDKIKYVLKPEDEPKETSPAKIEESEEKINKKNHFSLEYK